MIVIIGVLGGFGKGVIIALDDYGNVGTISVTTKGNDNTFTKTTSNTRLLRWCRHCRSRQYWIDWCGNFVFEVVLPSVKSVMVSLPAFLKP